MLHLQPEWIVDLADKVYTLSQIILCTYLLEPDLLLLGLASGQLVTVDCSNQSVECIGQLDGGLLAGAASPDGSHVALLTGEMKLLLLDLVRG